MTLQGLLFEMMTQPPTKNSVSTGLHMAPTLGHIITGNALQAMVTLIETTMVALHRTMKKHLAGHRTHGTITMSHLVHLEVV